MTTKNSNQTADRGYAKKATGLFVAGARVVFAEDTYNGSPIAKGTRGTIRSISNAGFRGIEASVKLDDGRSAYCVNLDMLNIRAKASR